MAKFENLAAAARTIGKEEWHELLAANVRLLEESIHEETDGFFPHPWVDIGPGYVFGPAFGHWDIIHTVMNIVIDEPEEARRQLENDLYHQRPDGYLPGAFFMRDGKFEVSELNSHPPVWVFAADRYFELTGDRPFLEKCLVAAKAQLKWFEQNRKCPAGGYFYRDILTNSYESGVDQGVRFDVKSSVPLACVDATAHVFAIADLCAKWSAILGEEDAAYKFLAAEIQSFINMKLYDEKTGWYYDEWDMADADRMPTAFEGMWPVAVGAATRSAAERAAEHLTCPEEFFGVHPVASVSLASPKFELRMWRGPSWNSMTMWALEGLMKYGLTEAAAKIAEAALDATAKIYHDTGLIWEFYHPLGDAPETVSRKPENHQHKNQPSSSYLGHAPLIEIARIWEKAAH